MLSCIVFLGNFTIQLTTFLFIESSGLFVCLFVFVFVFLSALYTIVLSLYFIFNVSFSGLTWQENLILDTFKNITMSFSITVNSQRESLNLGRLFQV